jgi:hypothetical protein
LQPRPEGPPTPAQPAYRRPIRRADRPPRLERHPTPPRRWGQAYRKSAEKRAWTHVRNPIPASPLFIFGGRYGRNPMDCTVRNTQFPGSGSGPIIVRKRHGRMYQAHSPSNCPYDSLHSAPSHAQKPRAPSMRVFSGAWVGDREPNPPASTRKKGRPNGQPLDRKHVAQRPLIPDS